MLSLDKVQRIMKIYKKWGFRLNRKIHKNVNSLNDNNYWKIVPYETKGFIGYMIDTIDSFNDIFNKIIENIDNDAITFKDIENIELVEKEAFTLVMPNQYYGYSEFIENFKKTSLWKNDNFDNPNFKKVESIYSNGKKYFFNLTDLSELKKTLRRNKNMDKNFNINNNTTNNISGGNVTQVNGNMQGDINNSNEKSLDIKEILDIIQQIEDKIDPKYKDDIIEVRKNAKSGKWNKVKELISKVPDSLKAAGEIAELFNKLTSHL